MLTWKSVLKTQRLVTLKVQKYFKNIQWNITKKPRVWTRCVFIKSTPASDWVSSFPIATVPLRSSPSQTVNNGSSKMRSRRTYFNHARSNFLKQCFNSLNISPSLNASNPTRNRLQWTNFIISYFASFNFKPWKDWWCRFELFLASGVASNFSSFSGDPSNSLSVWELLLKLSQLADCLLLGLKSSRSHDHCLLIEIISTVAASKVLPYF